MENSEFQVLVQAVIDAKDVQSRLAAIKNLSVTIEKINLDQSVIDSLKNQLSKNGIDVKLVFGNTEQIKSQAIQTGQQIGKLISDSAEKAISKTGSKSISKYFNINPTTSVQLQAEMEKLVNKWTNAKGKLTDIKINTKTSFDENAEKQIERLHQVTVTYKNELNEVIKKTIAWRKTGVGFDTNGNLKDIYGFVEVANQYSKSLDTATAKTDNFANQQKKAVANLSNQLKQIYSNATDPNASKPIKNNDNLANLKTQYDNITAAIGKLKSVSGSAFTDEQNKVNTLISDLKIMIKEYKNAETVATSLRSKDLSTVKSQYSSKLDVLTTKMKSSGTYTKGFQNGADNLKNILNNATDASGLTAFLNGLDKLDAGYKRAKASAEALNQAQKIGIKVSGMEAQIANWQRISPEINNFKTNILGADVTVQSLLDDLGKVSTKDDFSVVSDKVSAFGKAAKAAGITLTELTINSESAANTINKILSLTNGGIKNDYSTQIAKLAGNFKNLGLSQDEVNAKLKNTEKAFSDLKQRVNQPFDKNDYQEIISLNDRLQKELAESSNEYVKLQAAAKGFVSTQQRLSLANTIEAWNQKNSKATKEAIASNEAYIQSLRNMDTQMTKTQFADIKTGFKNIENSMRGLGKLGASFRDQFKQAASSMTYLFSASTLVMSFANQVRKIPQIITGLDTALVDLKKTANMTKSELQDFYYSSNETAKQMGTTTQQIIEQASAWSRLGYSSASAATQMAKYSSMFKTISPGMDLDSATDGLVSVMKAFKIGEDDVSEVVDGIMSKINIVGNTRALSNNDIVEFLTRSSSAMAEANNTLEDTIALGTAITEITRDSANAGQVLKTVSMKIRGYDEETEEYIGGVEELSGKIADLTKTASTPGGISLFSDAAKTEFKSTRELFGEIAEIYDQLDDKTQAKLLEALAGKRNGQAVAAILNNYEAVEDSLNSMANSAGNAEAEMAVAMDSIEYKVNRLKETGTGIAQNLLSRDDAKTAIAGFTKIAEAVDFLTDKLGLFGTLGLVASFKNVGRDKMFSLNFLLF